MQLCMGMNEVLHLVWISSYYFLLRYSPTTSYAAARFTDRFLLTLVASASVMRIIFVVVSRWWCGTCRLVPGTKIEHALNALCLLVASATSVVLWALYHERKEERYHERRMHRGAGEGDNLPALEVTVVVLCVISLLSYLTAFSQILKQCLERDVILPSGRGFVMTTIYGRRITIQDEPSSSPRVAQPESQVRSFVLDENTASLFGVSSSSCMICLGEIEPGCSVGKLPCAHLFHDDCIRKWLRHGHFCPMRCPWPSIPNASSFADPGRVPLTHLRPGAVAM
jgi:hypothetical protein